MQFLYIHVLTYRLYPVDKSRIDNMDAMDQPGQDKKKDWQRWSSAILTAVAAHTLGQLG
jgi:hypothetical protein